MRWADALDEADEGLPYKCYAFELTPAAGVSRDTLLEILRDSRGGDTRGSSNIPGNPVQLRVWIAPEDLHSARLTLARLEGVADVVIRHVTDPEPFGPSYPTWDGNEEWFDDVESPESA